MQTGEDEKTLRKIMDMTRAVSILIFGFALLLLLEFGICNV